MSFLNVPATVTVFQFNAWQQALADEAVFAFARGVAGIVSNVHRVPFEDIAGKDSISSFDAHPHDFEEDEDEVMVVFCYPPESTEEREESKLKQEKLLAMLHEVLNLPDDDDDDEECKKQRKKRRKNQNKNQMPPQHHFPSDTATAVSSPPAQPDDATASTTLTVTETNNTSGNDPIGTPSDQLTTSVVDGNLPASHTTADNHHQITDWHRQRQWTPHHHHLTI
jgi:hypothetical protein